MQGGSLDGLDSSCTSNQSEGRGVRFRKARHLRNLDDLYGWAMSPAVPAGEPPMGGRRGGSSTAGWRSSQQAAPRGRSYRSGSRVSGRATRETQCLPARASAHGGTERGACRSTIQTLTGASPEIGKPAPGPPQQGALCASPPLLTALPVPEHALEKDSSCSWLQGDLPDGAPHPDEHGAPKKRQTASFRRLPWNSRTTANSVKRLRAPESG